MHSMRKLKAYARHKGGTCTSPDGLYHGLMAKYDWTCDSGHPWTATAQSVYKMGTWCPTCALNRRRTSQYPRKRRTKGAQLPTNTAASNKKTTEDERRYAESRGWRLVSDAYVNNRTPLIYECIDHGHRWKSTPLNARVRKECPGCRQERKKTNGTTKQFYNTRRFGRKRIRAARKKRARRKNDV